jgi:hypothetical protein
VTRSNGVRKILNTLLTEAGAFRTTLTAFRRGILEGRSEAELQSIDARAQQHFDASNTARYRLSRKMCGNLYVLSRVWGLG